MTKHEKKYIREQKQKEIIKIESELLKFSKKNNIFFEYSFKTSHVESDIFTLFIYFDKLYLDIQFDFRNLFGYGFQLKKDSNDYRKEYDLLINFRDILFASGYIEFLEYFYKYDFINNISKLKKQQRTIKTRRKRIIRIDNEITELKHLFIENYH